MIDVILLKYALFCVICRWQMKSC